MPQAMSVSQRGFISLGADDAGNATAMLAHRLGWMRWSSQLRVASAYVLFAALWIYFSDELVCLLSSDPELIHAAQSIKGWFFVMVTGVMLYWLVARDVTEVEHAHADLRDSYEQTMRAWVNVMDLRHKETRDHTLRVTRMTVALARLAGIAGKQLKDVEYGAILHDIGKIGIPDEVLTKPGALSAEEWVQMKRHPQIAHDLLSSVNYLCSSVDIPWCHHEKWDGSGYPRALRGSDIPLAARVFAVVDVWDALSFDRVYKKAWPEEQVLQHLRTQAGQHFDPAIVQLFIDHYDELKRVALSP